MIKCSFCGDEDPKSKLLPGMGAWICIACVLKAWEVVQEDTKYLSPIPYAGTLRPAEIKQELDKYVIGQDEAKKTLAVAAFNHMQRLASTSRDVRIKKSNVLLVGATGVGKTLLVETLGNILGVPFIVADSSSFTSAGYIGSSAEDVLADLVDKCKGSITEAERGIIYLDEIDKLAVGGDNKKEINMGRGAQHNFLKLIEGATVPVGRQNKSANKSEFQIDTSNILFICGGSFEGLEDIVSRRQRPNSIGFHNPVSSLNTKDSFANRVRDVMPSDLVEFGLLPELMGRLPIIAVLEDLTVKDLEHILSEPKDSLIKQYTALFAMSGITLEVEPDALTAWASLALEKKVGARGLRGLVEDTLKEVMFETPSDPGIKKIVITADTVLKKQVPLTFHEAALNSMSN